MAPEVEGIAEEEMEDLNVQPVGMDSHSDSPNPASPRQAAYLDRAVDEQFGDREPDTVTSVLTKVPPAQLATSPSPPRRGISPPRRVVERATSARTHGFKERTYKILGAQVSTTVPPAVLPSPASFVSSPAFSGATVNPEGRTHSSTAQASSAL